MWLTSSLKILPSCLIYTCIQKLPSQKHKTKSFHIVCVKGKIFCFNWHRLMNNLVLKIYTLFYSGENLLETSPAHINLFQRQSLFKAHLQKLQSCGLLECAAHMDRAGSGPAATSGRQMRASLKPSHQSRSRALSTKSNFSLDIDPQPACACSDKESIFIITPHKRTLDLTLAFINSFIDCSTTYNFANMIILSRRAN
jgi:hypothetical protein